MSQSPLMVEERERLEGQSHEAEKQPYEVLENAFTAVISRQNSPLNNIVFGSNIFGTEFWKRALLSTFCNQYFLIQLSSILEFQQVFQGPGPSGQDDLSLFLLLLVGSICRIFH